MRAVGAVAFREQFEARVDGAFELRSGARQERCDGACVCVRVCVCEVGVAETVIGGSAGGSAVGLSLKQVGQTGQREGEGEIGVISRTTTARIRRNADKEHKGHDPK